MKSALKIALLTTTSIVSFTVLETSSVIAATFSESKAFLNINNFSILPQNPDAESDRDTVSFSGTTDSIVNSNGDGTLAFVIDNNNPSFLNINFESDASGEGKKYFGFGQSSAFATGDFSVLPNDILSFDFTVNLDLNSIVDDPVDGSINTFSGLSFFVLDVNNSNNILGAFRGVGNLDTNLTNNVNNDTLFAQSSPNITFSGTRNVAFGGNRESGNLSLSGNFSQIFTTSSLIRLQVSALNTSCVQAPINDNPCVKVPEPSSVISLVIGFLGVSFWKRRSS